MTSRPPLAISQRQPQRSLSGSGLSHRPPHQRTLSQQYFPPSPVRNDLTPDEGDSAQGRHGGTPRRGGSKLKLELELANDGIEHAGFTQSPQHPDPLSANKAFTPSRMMHMADASELSDESSHPSRAQTAENDSVPLPMPPRRVRFVVPTSRPQTTTTSAPTKKDVRPRPFVLETPAAAPQYSNMGRPEPTGFADFFPWRGNHPEDRFSESVIKNGYFDKAASQGSAEMTTARHTLFPAMKHKSGLNTLATLFMGIMSQRRHSGQITPHSTFKPPPRATLTDTKREMWLKELANPTVPLRRLSRTIPHGVRGKVLLEQCLNKNVPTDRAVWLAKCVGANEIRAFKRKGVNGAFLGGGEAKWIRDWTIFVEQFVDKVVSTFGETNWKAKVTYAVRLATHLYAEHLLDREHYMDWLVSGLENSSQARLPMWILINRIYWRDLLRLRKYGRRLVSAILGHHTAIYQHPDRDVLMPLCVHLTSMVQSLLFACPENFVHPPSWSKYRDVFLSSLPIHDDAQQDAFKSIDRRNDRLSHTAIESQPALRGVVVRLLDTSIRRPFTEDLAGRIWKLSEDKSSLIGTVLEWCTSLYRPGITKVYIARALLGSWFSQGVDITAPILEFLDTGALGETGQKHLIYHLVSNLVAARQFSAAQYLRWLIARGCLVDPNEIRVDGPCLTRLLVELPLGSLDDSTRSLRAGLLRRVGFSVDYETQDMAAALKHVGYSLGVPMQANDPILERPPMSLQKLVKRIKLSSHALRSEVGRWLSLDFVAGFAPFTQPDKGGMELLAARFDAVRTILEATEDYWRLEIVLKALIGSFNAELLAACADTVSLHLSVFAAIGSAKSLFRSLLERLKAISEEQGIGARPLLASLTRLAPRIEGFGDVAAQLQNDLTRTDRSSSVDASSPLSDNMAMQLQDDETELSEQIEKLASYSSADRPTMERLFQAIINRLQSCWGKADERQRPYCALLARLRVFDIQHFDAMMKGWVLHIRKLLRRPPVSQIFPLLLSSGCLSLSILFASVSRNATQGAQPHESVGMASIYTQEILQLLMTPPTSSPFMAFDDRYRFRIFQEQARAEHAKEMMLVVRGALAEYSAPRHEQVPPIAHPLDDDMAKEQFLQLLRELILFDAHAASQILALKNPDPRLALLIEDVTTKLLVPGGGGGQKTFEQVLELANEFTLPFCQVKLALNLALDDSAGPAGTERLQAQLTTLSKAMDNAIEANNIMWTGMLSCLSPEVTQHMKHRAEARFLYLVPSLRNPPLADNVSQRHVNMAENLLAVVDSIMRTGAMSKSPQILPGAVEKLAELWEIVGSQTPETASLREVTLSHWLPLLLTYLTLHAVPNPAAADTPKPCQEARAKAVLVLGGLINELDTSGPSDLMQRAFDLALLLVDYLPDDVRLQCVNIVKSTTSDPRLRYLLSFASTPAENLMLAHREKPPSNLSLHERKALALGLGMGMLPERLSPFVVKRWEILNEPTPNVGENDTSLSLHLFDARKL